jgi:hypothetical protein
MRVKECENSFIIFPFPKSTSYQIHITKASPLYGNAKSRVSCPAFGKISPTKTRLLAQALLKASDIAGAMNKRWGGRKHQAPFSMLSSTLKGVL